MCVNDDDGLFLFDANDYRDKCCIANALEACPKQLIVKRMPCDFIESNFLTLFNISLITFSINKLVIIIVIQRWTCSILMCFKA